MTKPVHGGNLAWAAIVAGCPISGILDFSASINPLGLPDSAINAIQTNISQLRAYPDPNYQELKKALSLSHPPLTPEWILPGNGAAELLTWAALELSKLETTYLVVPAFGDYRRALKTFTANVVECPLTMGEWKLEKLEIEADTNKGLLLNNPHNPTGMLMELETIVPYLEKFGLVVVDEAFMDFLPPPQLQSLVPLVTKFENLVILRSLTKFYSLPGLRLGYAISHPERLQKWQKWRDPWPVNTLALSVAQAVIQDQAFQQETWDWLADARPQLFASLAELPGLQPYPGAANFLLVHSQKSVDELQIKLLKQHKILIRDCLSFAELGDRYFRVAVRTQEENQKLIDALAEILK
ncbi:MAG: threonine-phosphate decarboxylase CobD [Trichodesmium sp. MO_231.B1]|nr:threonine-phosphate decarboxylase CobD [Trichodesmium sp. MO_231.B1]